MKNRKRNRLPDYDYSTPGMYFITICIKNRDVQFGEIVHGSVKLNETGQIAYRCWQDIPDHFPQASIDEFVIMPDHVHGIVFVGNADLRSLQKPVTDRTKMMIPKIIHGYKSTVTRTINREQNIHFAWQKSYHDRIIRDDDELDRIRQYIRNNPVTWDYGV